MHVLVLGGTSDIAKAVTREFARNESCSFCIASRDVDRASKLTQDLKIRYQAEAHPSRFEATEWEGHKEFWRSLDPKPEVVVLAFGYLGSQSQAQADFREAWRILNTNLIGSISILETVAAHFEKQGRGTVIVISSVAGERGRKSNYVYGAAKGGLIVYLSGLRNRLSRRGVHVITVLPGFVRTKMTVHMDLPALLTEEPRRIATDVYRAFQKRQDILYTPWFWRWIMLVVKILPERIFKRLNL